MNNMKYVDEYRDPELAKRVSAEIARLSGSRPLKLMEVCGGHTHTIYKHGIEDVLPPNIDLVHGPGCPVEARAATIAAKPRPGCSTAAVLDRRASSEPAERLAPARLGPGPRAGPVRAGRT